MIKLKSSLPVHAVRKYILVYLILLGMLVIYLLTTNYYSEGTGLLPVKRSYEEKSQKSLHQKQMFEVEKKMRHCFMSLHMGYLIHNDTFWTKAITDAQHLTNLIQTVLPSDLTLPAGHNNSICWRSKFVLKYTKNRICKGKLNNKLLYIDFERDKSLVTDPRQYYRNMLKMKTYDKGLFTSILCIPRVFLAGFPKSGSTALDAILTVHPKIHHGLSKEPRWWIPPQLHPNSGHFEPSLPYFIKYLLQYQYKNMNEINKEDILLIDSSPNLFPSWSNIGHSHSYNYEGLCTVPAVMSTFIPHPQFIVILRDPIEYLYSKFWYGCSSNVVSKQKLTQEQIPRGPQAFHAMIMSRLKKFRYCMMTQEHSIVEKCVLEQALFTDQHDDYFPCGQAPLGAAVYYVHIAKWMSLFPRESFFFVTSEEFFQSPFTVANRVWDFLGLSPDFNANYTLLNERMKRGANNQIKFDYRSDPELQMLPRTRLVLKKFFKPFNIKLSSLLSTDGKPWTQEWQSRKV